MKKISTLFLAMAFSMGMQAQFSISPSPNPADVVNNILLGEGVAVSNVIFTGDPLQLGAFSGLSGVAIPSGVILSSGAVQAANDGSSVLSSTTNQNDADLLTVANSVALLIGQDFSAYAVKDVAALEFDFVTLGNNVNFNFVFGSNEYLEYVNTSFNDVFGFFISGPGISGPYANGAENIAVVPNSDPQLPVTISSVNNVINSESYIDNPNHIDLFVDGYTTMFTASMGNLIPGEVYHIRLAIADANDAILDSFVFLEAGSFSSSVEANGSPVDFDNDGFVDVNDLFVLIANYGCTGVGCPADVNGDQIVNILDVQVFIAAFGGSVD
jgi:hypothetical protein